MLKEKVQLLLKSLPQKLRRHCVPLPEYATGFIERIGPGARSSLIDALIADVRTERGIACQHDDFRRETLPAHLVMNIKVVDEHGRQLAMGRSLAHLKAELGGEARRTFQRVADAKVIEELREQITDWDFGVLPEVLEIRRGGQTLVGFPGLVDHSTYCSIDVFDTPEDAAAEHASGLRRLFRLQLKEQVKFLEKTLENLQMVQVRAATIAPLARALPSFEDLREQIITAAVDRTCLTLPWPVDRRDVCRAQGRRARPAQPDRA